MKVSYLLFLLFSVFSLFGCEKINEIDSMKVESLEDKINLQLIEEIEKLPNYAVKIYYGNLTVEEKTVIWTRHLKRHLESGIYSDAQLAHINKLFALINVDFFRKIGTDELTIKMKEFEKDWFYKASQDKLFTEKELFFIGTVDGLGVIDENFSNKVPSSGRVEETCYCYYSISCGLTGGYCGGKCTAGNYNCGIVGSTQCSGKCSGAVKV